ncbi:hypothetical protein PoB_001935400 [Plakobranchus ocellatus]|uniref:Uncharacterized protein n=1 Tax=Plakobranchus ocellatus TaxID=259542 RepID=A0AAV3ZBW9_9GAST|nr:hypothetical protein PoB_001935400 [Plakobranchus ocellatus]
MTKRLSIELAVWSATQPEDLATHSSSASGSEEETPTLSVGFLTHTATAQPDQGSLSNIYDLHSSRIAHALGIPRRKKLKIVSSSFEKGRKHDLPRDKCHNKITSLVKIISELITTPKEKNRRPGPFGYLGLMEKPPPSLPRLLPNFRILSSVYSYDHQIFGIINNV